MEAMMGIPTQPKLMNLLLVDDEPRATRRIGRILRSKGFRVHVAPSADRALDKLNRYAADAVILDMRLGDEGSPDGLALAQQIRAINPSLPLVGMSSFAVTAFQARDTDATVDQWLNKIDIVEKGDADALDKLVSKIKSSKVIVPQPPAPKPIVDIVGVGRILAKHLAYDPTLVHGLSPEEFEELICDRLSAMGLEAQRVGGTFQKDGGIDIVFWSKRPNFPFLGAAQVKHHRRPKTKEGVGSVRDFAGAIAGQAFGAGIIVTNTSFTADAEWFARERAKLIRLRDYHDVRRWLLGDFTDDAEWREIPESIQLCPGVTIDLRRRTKR
jgi:CheY-like chemotaxis protein